MEPLALPPHVEEQGQAYDAAADAAAMDAAPLQDYTSEWTQQQAAADAGASQEPPTGEGSTKDKEPEQEAPGANAETNAREFLEAYDVLQSYAFHFYSGGKPAEDFTLPKFAKDRAAHHLAKGLEKMGSPELPWWLGLLIVLAPPSVINWMAAKEHRRAAQEEPPAAPPTPTGEHRHTAREPITPDSITRPDGTTVQVKTEQRTTTAPKAPLLHGTCEVCAGPLLRKNRRYCSQSCSGKGKAKQAQANKAAPTP